MPKFILAALLCLHGFSHITGFAEAADPIANTGLTMPVSKAYGALWMACAFLFILSAAAYVSRRDTWWVLALAGVTLSQYLVVVFWADAKFGTIPNLLILIAVLAAFPHWRFRRAALRDVAALLADAGPASAIVDDAALDRLPAPVATWLRRAEVIGKPLVRTARLQQAATMRTKPEGRWMPVRAEQWFNAEKPGFVWLADVTAGPGFHIAGRDSLLGARGRMSIKALSCFPIADATGPEIDQGALVRYLAEIIWLPSAALRGGIQWTANDARSATATLAAGETSAEVHFEFNTAGDPERIRARRYYTRPDGVALEPWRVDLDPDSFDTLNGIRIPTRATVTWELETGPFQWYRVEVEHAHWNGA